MHISHKNDLMAGPPEVLVFGSGNVLFGDDGFGPAVIEALLRQGLPPTVRAINAGGAIREYLLDLLLLPESRPALLLLVDAAHEDGETPGMVRERDPAGMDAARIHDYSLHQFPTVNLLRELAKETGMAIRLITAQASTIPDRPLIGLSPAMTAAVATASTLILRTIASHATAEATRP